jgi:hypothetical protein
VGAAITSSTSEALGSEFSFQRCGVFGALVLRELWRYRVFRSVGIFGCP